MFQQIKTLPPTTMKINTKPARRQECLRIKVLRKTVSLRDFKRKPIVIELTTAEGKRQLEAALIRSRQIEKSIETPKSPRKKVEENENRTTMSLFNFKTITANFVRKFGIERKVIEPVKKAKTYKGMKTGKNGGKFIYM